MSPRPMHVPAAYSLAHYIFGGLSAVCPLVIPCFLAYQWIQYVAGVRFFFFDRRFFTNPHACVERGNGAQHTLYKVGQFATGYVLCLTALKMREAHIDPELL